MLDLGCGPGADLGTIAEQSGRAVGVDLSIAMVCEAGHVSSASVVVANAEQLPFPDAAFDACWASLVLIHVAKPLEAIREVARVLKPAGRAVFVEPDHGSHIVATSVPDVFERVKRHRWSMFRNPLVGRSLPALAVDAGMSVTRTWAIPIVYTSLAAARAAGGPFDRAIADTTDTGAITRQEADRYVASLVEADEQGAFCFVALAIAMVATPRHS